MKNAAQLDHVVLLLPYNDLTEPPNWLKDNFVISPGGRHADGKTENRLVLFRDGTYIEIIAFVNDDQEARRGHPWDKPFGIVDYALTASTTPDFDALNAELAAAKTGITYQQPKAGGRTRPDGVELQWEVASPQGIERGAMPFFCLDVTPRERRVPLSDEATDHPCGALGMAGVQIKIDSGRVTRLNQALAATVNPTEQPGRYDVGVTHPVHGARKPTVRVNVAPEMDVLQLALIIQIVEGNELPPDVRHSVGDGIVSIGFERA